MSSYLEPEKFAKTLMDCPFCGKRPSVKYIGNDRTKRRSIKVKCPGCRIERTDAAIMHDFDFLESVACESWNRRSANHDTRG